jgi:putative alpha-1,2-mannosidase
MYFESHNGQSGGEVLPNPYYLPGNEISLVDVFYFNLVGCVRTQYWAMRVLLMHFTASPHGIPGDNDYCTLSAFALFTAIGVYPKSGSTQYFVGSPTVTWATLSLIGN